MLYSFFDLSIKMINNKVVERLLLELPKMYGNIEYRFFGKNKNVFTKDFVEYLNQRNCDIGASEIWSIPNLQEVFWHIDSNPPVDFAKMLIPWNSSSILLEWGECLSVSDSNQKQGVRNYQYLHFENTEVKTIGDTLIDRPIIINPSILHRAINQNNQVYHSLNLSILDKNTGIRLTTAEAVGRLVGVL